MADRSHRRSRVGILLASVFLGAVAGWLIHTNRAPSFERSRPVLERPSGRVGVTGLTFPPDNPARFRLQPVPAFPHLTFSRPVLLLESPDGRGRLYVVERDGTIVSFRNDDEARETKVFLDLTDKVWSTGGSGLLGMAFDPGFAENGTFYLHYSTRNPRTIVVSAMQVMPDDPDRADPDSERVLLRLEKTHHSHNGGMLAFGPDGMLYIAIGDAMKRSRHTGYAQRMDALLGKMLRIDPWGGTPYGIPPDNPYVGAGPDVREEIWASGLRQPWRFSFDPFTGELYLGEVGGDQIEEINLVQRGGNYGWAVYEGWNSIDDKSDLAFGDTVPPIVSLPHTVARAVIGGYVCRDPDLPAFRGAYIFGDNNSGRIWALRAEGGEVLSNDEVSFVSGVCSFGEDAAGHLYAIGLSGNLWRFEDRQAEADATPFPELLSQTGLLTDTASLGWIDGMVPYDVLSPAWTDGAAMRRWIALPEGTRIGADETDRWQFPSGTVLVQHLDHPATGDDPAQRLETRVLVHETSGWAGYTYRWNKDQADARLVTFGQTETLDPTGDPDDSAHQFPGPSDCMRCHNTAAGSVLGLRRDQVDFPVRYDDGVHDQLQVWSELGLLDGPVGEAPASPALVDPADSGQSLDRRARSYLDTNCAPCHRRSGPADMIDLRLEVPLEDTNTLGVKPQNDKADGSVVIAPGDRRGSFLYHRVQSSRAKYHMPPVGTARVDPLGDWLILRWIEDELPGRAAEQ